MKLFAPATRTWFSETFAGERVPTLEETLALLEALNLGANIEIKPTAGREAETGKAVELDVEDPQGHFNLAEFYYDNGQLKEAEAACRQAVRLDQEFAFAYLTLGNICLDQDQVQEAVQCFKKFLDHEKSPASEDIRNEVSALIEGLKGEV